MDDLQRFIQEQSQNEPGFAEALEDSRAAASLLRALIDARSRTGLTQGDVATRMRTSQSAVSDLEAGDIDSRLSTYQRYARAVGYRLVVEVADTGFGEARAPEFAQALHDYNVAESAPDALGDAGGPYAPTLTRRTAVRLARSHAEPSAPKWQRSVADSETEFVEAV